MVTVTTINLHTCKNFYLHAITNKTSKLDLNTIKFIFCLIIPFFVSVFIYFFLKILFSIKATFLFDELFLTENSYITIKFNKPFELMHECIDKSKTNQLQNMVYE